MLLHKSLLGIIGVYMRYRVANINDLENLAKLHAESWRESYRGIFSDEFLDNDVLKERKSYWIDRLCSPKKNQFVMIAVDDNRITGFICAFGGESSKWGTFIENLHVSKSMQGKGIGKQLMYLAAKWADESFVHKGVYLEVLEDNFSARDFYLRFGAKHQKTSLWQPPGSKNMVNDLLYVWESNIPLLEIKN